MIIIKNNILYILASKINLNIRGPMIERFIKRLRNNNIEIFSLLYVNNNEINIKVLKKDYAKIFKLKTVYDIKILDYYGIAKINNSFFQNKYIIISIVTMIGFIAMYYTKQINSFYYTLGMFIWYVGFLYLSTTWEDR